MTVKLLKRSLAAILPTGLALLLVFGSSAMAQGGGGNNNSSGGGGHHGGGGSGGGDSGGSGGSGGHGAPEIDPGIAAAGIFLLVGGTLVLTARRRPETT